METQLPGIWVAAVVGAEVPVVAPRLPWNSRNFGGLPCAKVGEGAEDAFQPLGDLDCLFGGWRLGGRKVILDLGGPSTRRKKCQKALSISCFWKSWQDHNFLVVPPRARQTGDMRYLAPTGAQNRI